MGLASNPRLEGRAGRLLDEAYGLSTYGGRTEHVYGEILSAAQSWSHRRRVIINAEVVRLLGRDRHCNPCFVVTNFHEMPAAVSCQCGDRENGLKECLTGWRWTARVAARLGESMPRTAGGGSGVCPAADVAATGPRHGLRHGTRLHIAGAAAKAGRVGGTLGAPHRAVPAPPGALGHDLQRVAVGAGRGSPHPGLVQEGGAEGSDRRCVS